MNLTREQHSKHPFAGRNTQHYTLKYFKDYFLFEVEFALNAINGFTLPKTVKKHFIGLPPASLFYLKLLNAFKSLSIRVQNLNVKKLSY